MPPEPLAIVVLGMHRSGTSCLAGMLAAGRIASAGDAVRNWDNARGHHEMLDAVRLNEAVLAHSGGHWLSPPREVRWTGEHAASRDRLLRAQVEGRPALLKDPRTLLALPFWRASRVPYRAVGIVRHPLAVARSLEAWREMPLAEGVALWSAHNRALAGDHGRDAYPVVDFERPKSAVVAAVAAAFELDPALLDDAYDERLVHHDAGDAVAVPGLDEAVALYRRLAGAELAGSCDGAPPARPAFPRAELAGAPPARPAFPRAELAEVARLLRESDRAATLRPARAALASVADAAAVLVPLVATLVRHRAYAEASTLIAEARLDDGLSHLLLGKLLLAMGDAVGAVHQLDAACAVPRPFFQARHLRPQALRAAGRHAEAREALHAVASDALYPHGPLATLAEWSWLDGDRGAALAEMRRAIAAAPLHRRGRLRTRLAEWLREQEEPLAARRELELALDEDPAYERSRAVLAETLR